jgi:hypothetical protein
MFLLTNLAKQDLKNCLKIASKCTKLLSLKKFEGDTLNEPSFWTGVGVGRRDGWDEELEGRGEGWVHEHHQELLQGSAT